MSSLMWIWLLFSLLRVLLVFVPQTSYIHPDEFFQSTEIAAGDVLNLETFRAWEFTSPHPIRCISSVYLLAGLPLHILRLFQPINKISPYCLLVLPRLFICVLSFLCDLSLHRLCSIFHKNADLIVTVFAGSFITVVYYTRTLSNTIEAILLALLLWVVGRESYLRQKALIKNDSKEDVHVPRATFTVAVIVTLGFFNRPTFLAFAFVPLLWWLLSGLSFTRKNALMVVERACGLIAPSFLCGLCLAVIDTLYYKPFVIECIFKGHWRDISLVVTPWNFIQYNLDHSKLELHGLHPRWLHLVVNMPLLFSVFGVVFLWKVFVFMCENARRVKTSSFSLFELLMIGTVMSSLCILSTLPHQEPRFLVPLLMPVLLACNKSITVATSSGLLLLIIWVLSNGIGLIFYGFLHQAGVIPCILGLYTHLQKPEICSAHVIFFHTYMPPRHLFLLQKGQRKVNITDLGGAHVTMLDKLLDHDIPDVTSCKTHRAYIVAPSTQERFIDEMMKETEKTLEIVYSWMPHFSGEDPPDFSKTIRALKALNVPEILSELINQWRLSIYEVVLPMEQNENTSSKLTSS